MSVTSPGEDESALGSDWQALRPEGWEESALAAVAPLRVPRKVRMEQRDGTVRWTAGTEEVFVVDGAGTALLIRVARLHLLDADGQLGEVASLVESFGPMGLCIRHGLPVGHVPVRAVRVVRADLDDFVGQKSRARRPWDEWRACSESGRPLVPGGLSRKYVGSERISDWVRISKEAAAIVALGAWIMRTREALHQAAAIGAAPKSIPAPTLIDIEPLDRLLDAPLDLVALWSDATDPEGRRRVITPEGLSEVPLGPEPDDPEEKKAWEAAFAYAESLWVHLDSRTRARRVEAVAKELERITVLALQRWLDEAELTVRVCVEPSTGRTSMRWGNGGLFSIVAIQMAMSFGGINSLAVCDVCRRSYQPSSRLRTGSHAYCDVCRADKNRFDALRQRLSRQATWPGPEQVRL